MIDKRQATRWLKALQIAKILFADLGYHTRYLAEIEQLVSSRDNPRDIESLIKEIETKVAELVRFHEESDTEISKENLEILDDSISKLEYVIGWHW